MAATTPAILPAPTLQAIPNKKASIEDTPLSLLELLKIYLNFLKFLNCKNFILKLR